LHRRKLHTRVDTEEQLKREEKTLHLKSLLFRTKFKAQSLRSLLKCQKDEWGAARGSETSRSSRK